MEKKVTKKRRTSKKVSAKLTRPKAVPAKTLYFSAIGRRKTAIAKIKLVKNGTGEFLVNNRDFKNYFPTFSLQKIASAPLEVSGLDRKVDVAARILGGGVAAQAQGFSLAIARALVKMDPALKLTLKKQGFLTRDARKKERKKPGLKRARRAPQWQKR
jgi:small subunit ribosomal protein S9